MMHQVYMPKFGANIETGIIVEWLKKEGEAVKKGEIIANVETSKALFEIEAEESGILKKILAPEGQEIPFNHVIAVITDSNEDITPVLSSIASQKKDKSAEFVKAMDEGVFEKNKEQKIRKMTPAARRLIKENKIDDEVLGTIQKEIIEEVDILPLTRATKVFIYGASTGAKQIIEIIRSSSRYQVIGIIDDNNKLFGKSIEGFEVLGDFEWLKKRYEEKRDFCVMVSSHSTNRERVFKRIKKNLPDMKLPPIIDSRAILLSGVKVGESSLIEAGVTLGHEVVIGRNVILNLGVKISHNCIIGDHSHIAIGAGISAAVVLEENVFVGAGVAINPAVMIGRNSIISPNSAVLNDVPENVVINGVPGRVVGKSKRGK